MSFSNSATALGCLLFNLTTFRSTPAHDAEQLAGDGFNFGKFLFVLGLKLFDTTSLSCGRWDIGTSIWKC